MIEIKEAIPCWGCWLQSAVACYYAWSTVHWASCVLCVVDCGWWLWAVGCGLVCGWALCARAPFSCPLNRSSLKKIETRKEHRIASESTNRRWWSFNFNSTSEVRVTNLGWNITQCPINICARGGAKRCRVASNSVADDKTSSPIINFMRKAKHNSIFLSCQVMKNTQ